MPTPAGVGLSPAMAVDLRMKSYEQLRYLLKDGILSDAEYLEQKKNILTSLQKLMS